MHILLIDHALEIHLLGSWLTTTAPQPAVLHCPPPPHVNGSRLTAIKKARGLGRGSAPHAPYAC